MQPEQVQLIGDVAGDIDPVLMSPAKLQWVLDNLLSDALRHMPSDGMIMLRAAPQGAMVAVDVEDTGEGIRPMICPISSSKPFGESARERAGRRETARARGWASPLLVVWSRRMGE